MLRRVVAAWAGFWFAPVDARGLALTRICMAAVGLWTAGELFPLLSYTAFPGGVPPADSARWASGSLIEPLLWAEALLTRPGPGLLFGLLVASFVAMGAGYRVPLTAGLAWLSLFWFQARNPIVLNGGDDFLRLATFYLAIGHLGVPPRSRAWSLDRVRATRPSEGGIPPGAVSEPPPIRAWPVRLLQLQLLTLYLASGIYKASGAEWWSGTALWLALSNPATTRVSLPELAELQPVFLAAGVAALTLQLAFPVLVWIPRTKAWVMGAGALFHVGTGLTMMLGPFPWVILSAYPAFLSGKIAPGRRVEYIPVGAAIRGRSHAATHDWNDPPPPPECAAMSQDDRNEATRRSFLLRLARASLFLPPTILSLGVRETSARGTGGAGGGKAVGQVTGGTLSPVSQQQMTAPEFRSQDQTTTSEQWSAPWNAPQGALPPWARPPSGRQDDGDEE